jgi:hypothetical protein
MESDRDRRWENAETLVGRLSAMGPANTYISQCKKLDEILGGCIVFEKPHLILCHFHIFKYT